MVTPISILRKISTCSKKYFLGSVEWESGEDVAIADPIVHITCKDKK